MFTALYVRLHTCGLDEFPAFAFYFFNSYIINHLIYDVETFFGFNGSEKRPEIPSRFLEYKCKKYSISFLFVCRRRWGRT